MNVPMDAIAFDAGTQIRAAINEGVVAEYADRMNEGVVFPPIVLFHDGTAHYIADGFHRYLASQRIGFTSIPADVRAGTKEDALWFALGANRANGQRLSQRDVKHAIEIALRAWPDRSTKQIAEHIGCSQPYVASVKGHLHISTDFTDRVGGADDRSYPAVRGPYKKTMREDIAVLVKAGEASGAICAKLRVRPEIVADVRRELGIATVDRSKGAVQARRDQMRTMAADGYTSRQIASAVGLAFDTCRLTLKKEQIDVPADRAVGKTVRHDSNRIINRIVMDAENLMEGTELIAFDSINREHIAEWLTSLKKSRDQLNAFIRCLMQEQQNNGEAA